MICPNRNPNPIPELLSDNNKYRRQLDWRLDQSHCAAAIGSSALAAGARVQGARVWDGHQLGGNHFSAPNRHAAVLKLLYSAHYSKSSMLGKLGELPSGVEEKTRYAAHYSNSSMLGKELVYGQEA